MPIEGIKQIIFFCFYFHKKRQNNTMALNIRPLFNSKIKRQIIKIHFAQNNLKIYCWILKYLLNRSLKNNLE
jgi:hypothetical protein